MASSAAVGVSKADPTAAPVFAQDRILVKFRPSVTTTRGADVLSRARAIPATLSVRARYFDTNIVSVRAATTDIATLVEQVAALPEVAHAEPDYLVYANGRPDDTHFGSLWGLENIGQSGGTAGADISAVAAWDQATGDGSLVVGVIDTGIDYNHPDLAANMWVNPGEIAGNGIDDDGNGYVDDVHGINAITGSGDPMDDHSHGTHCAGTIGAVGNNGRGVVGVAWDVKLMALKFLGASGSGFTSDAIEALAYATDMKSNYGVNIKITSNSWGGGGYSQSLADAIAASNAAGMLFVAAAGNDALDNDINPHYPSSYGAANVISVASSDRNDNSSWFSNYGATSVDLAAPGSAIYSTVPGGGYSTKSGTSMATPHVAGAAALLWGHQPNLSVADVKATLLQTVDPLDAFSGRVLTGGRLNVQAALGGRSPGYHIATSVSPSGAGRVACTPNPVEEGGDSTCTATANGGYRFANWSGDCSGSQRSCVLRAVTAAKDVTANFTTASYTVTATAGANGGISPRSRSVAHGNSTSFTVTPDTGYGASVTGCGGSLAGDTYTTGPITGACTVSASFSLNRYTVTATAGGNGGISPRSRSVAHGNSTSFTVTPDTGYGASVTGCGGSLAGDTYTTGPITGACTVSASFSPNRYSIVTATDPVEAGRVNCEPNPVDHGGDSICTATANDGYSFDTWGGDCGGGDLRCTLNGVVREQSVTASFVIASARITGAITDEATGLPLADAIVALYHWNDDNAWWRQVGQLLVDADGAFDVPALAAGTYYLHLDTTTDQYLSEYYGDTRDWQQKTQITLAPGQQIALAPIALTPRPVYLQDLHLSTDWLGPEGGTVALSGILVNTTSYSGPATYWVNLELWDETFQAATRLTLHGPRAISLSPGSIPFSIPLAIPAQTPDERWYRLELTLGLSRVKPLVNGDFGAVWKGADAPPIDPLTPDAVAGRRAVRLDARGHVLETRIQP